MCRQLQLNILSILAAFMFFPIANNAAAQILTYRAVVTGGPPATQAENIERLQLFHQRLQQNLGPSLVGIAWGCLDCTALEGPNPNTNKINYLFDRQRHHLFREFARAWDYVQRQKPNDEFALTFNAEDGPQPDCAPKPPPCDPAPFCPQSSFCDDKSPNKPGACDVCVP